MITHATNGRGESKIQVFRWESISIRADSRFAPSHWETSLQSNAVSHWLDANLESASVSKERMRYDLPTSLRIFSKSVSRYVRCVMWFICVHHMIIIGCIRWLITSWYLLTRTSATTMKACTSKGILRYVKHAVSMRYCHLSMDK